MRPARTGILTTNPAGDIVLRRVLVRVATGSDRGSERVLEEGTLVIGSHPEADLVVSDTGISRYHAELGLLADGVRVRDLGSTNGTFVGESRVESVVVHPPTEIRIGRTRVELLAADLPAPDAPPEQQRFGSLVGESLPMRRVFGLLAGAAASDAPLLLEGEEGTGKSAAAEAVHATSQRGGALAVVDFAQPFDLEEAARAARGGTLVFDRIERLPGSLSASVVSLLDRRERGELDFRPITLSRVDLRSQVESGAMRRDVYFHVAAIRVVMPPLRERREDVPLLVSAIAARLGSPGVELSADEVAPLANHAFSGNVRELARLVEQLLARTAPRTPVVAEPSETQGLPFKEAKEKLVDAFERRYVAALLKRHDGNISRAAAEAGLDRNYLARLAKKHGLR
ncbi:MAG: FHA domain-containing protein [Myxococcota bacterium]